MPKIFISYRRDDSSGWVQAMYGRLDHWFRGEVFLDVDAKQLRPGVNFKKVLEDAVNNCDVLIAVIGRNWLTVTNEQGRRRLDDPRDFVRIEIAYALKTEGKIEVIPVLVDKASMPRTEELPPELAELAWLQAVDISNTRFAYDMDRLIEHLKEMSPRSPGPPPPPAPTPAAPPSRTFQDFRPMFLGDEAPPTDEAGLVEWAKDTSLFRRRSAAVIVLAERGSSRLGEVANAACADPYWQVRMAAACADLLRPGTLTPANRAALDRDHVYWVQAVFKGDLGQRLRISDPKSKPSAAETFFDLMSG